MKEALLNKTKYLLNFKLNIDDSRYQKLLEKLFYDFFETTEGLYNDRQLSTNAYYNFLLNKCNKNIKSIIIPAKEFQYHPLGFLEFSVNLKDELSKYLEENIEVTQEMKTEVMKKNYFYYILKVIKNNEEGIGFAFKNRTSWNFLEESLNEQQAITLAKMKKSYKKEYKTMYPDGTTYHYFVYTKYLSSPEVLNVNAVTMLTAILGSKTLFRSEIESQVELLEGFDKEYDHLLGNLQYDKTGKKVYTSSTVINEFLKRIQKEKSAYKKLEYFKKLNSFLLEIFDYKVTTILNRKDNEKIKGLIEDMKVIDANILYNADYQLHLAMEHVKILKRVKTKLHNYLNQGKERSEKEYVIYSLNKKKKDVVTSSVQPIHVDNKYVLLHILDIRSMNSRVLIKANIHVVDYSSIATKIYGGIYISVKELKHLYSSSDLGVFTKESEVIRTALAGRVLNPTIMDIIKSERHNFLGEFIYSKEEDRCIIYKNKSIEEVLGKVM